MSIASLPASSTSAASLQAISLASQSSALVSEVLEFSQLSTASYPLSMAKWTSCLRAQPVATSLLLKCFEVFKDTSPSSAVVQATGGLMGHQYNVMTVLLPGGRETHLRADYWAVPPPGSDSRLVISCSDDHRTLTESGHLISRIAAPPSPPSSGPTLATLTALFDVALGRLVSRPYSVVGWNCFWMTDMLFYTLASRYAPQWLSGGTLTPDAPLRRYLRKEAGALETAIACATPNEAARWWAQLAGNAVRGIQVLFTQNAPDKFMMHDDEVADWVREWGRAK